jgi:hypothetical protein
MKYSLLFFLISIIIISCKKKEENYAISGSLSDPYQNIQVSGADVTLLAQKIESGMLNANFEEISSMQTDANGNFSFEFDVAAYSNYKLEIRKDNYFIKDVEINPNHVKKNEVYNDSYEIFSEAWLSLNIINNYPADITDNIAVSILHDAAGIYDCCSDSTASYEGTGVSENIVCKTYGGHTVTINWTVTSGGESNVFTQNVTCTAFDTTSFTISY